MSTPPEIAEGHRADIIECYVMLYKFNNNNWCKVCDVNTVKIYMDEPKSIFYLSIYPQDKSIAELHFILDKTCNYKKYSTYFHRLKTREDAVYGFLFLSGTFDEIPSSFKAIITEIIKTKQLATIPEKPIKPKESNVLRDSISKTNKRSLTRQRSTSTPDPEKTKPKQKHSIFNFFKRGVSGSLKPSVIKPAKDNSKREAVSYNELHVEFDDETKTLIGLPREWEEILETRFSMPYKYLNVVDVPGYTSKIPVILVKLRDMIVENNGLETIGIFRVPAGKSRVDQVMRELHKGVFTCKEVFVCAHILKKFYREMPKPILGQKSIDIFLDKVRDVGSNFNLVSMGRPSLENGLSNLPKSSINIVKKNAAIQEKEKFTRKVLNSIEEPQLSMFMFLLDFCCEIVRNESVNKMNYENLAIVLSPNIFTVKRVMKQLDLIKVTTEVKKFVKHCILMNMADKL